MPVNKAAKPRNAKPRKPCKDFPLTAHPNGQWCKKIRGKVHFFGIWACPDAAREKYLAEKDELQAGRQPRRLSSGKLTTGDLVNSFLARCRDRVTTGDLSAMSYADYVTVGRLVIEHLGRNSDPEQLRPLDFAAFRVAMARKYAPSRLSKIVTVTRMMIKWAHASELIDRIPRFGPDFSVAGKKAARIQKAQQGKKLLRREDMQSLLEAADTKWKAILLLCLNTGLGNSDIARLKLSNIEGEWLHMARGKTGVDRRIPLWPETLQAVQDAIRDRHKPKVGAEELLFLSGHGGPLIAVWEKGHRTDLTIEGFRRIAKAAGVHKDRMGLYWLRHTFQTIGDEVRDPIATSAIMGHVDASMAGNYRERISDDRLRAVADHVRAWLFPPKNLSSTRQGRSHKVKPAPAAEGKATLKIHRA